MLRSLFSGVSGMKNNQIKMDVIGNNIANVNTTAFKSGRVRFQDIFSQTIKDASGPSAAGRGGINPRQVGLGTTVAAVDTIVTQGSLQPTGRPLDCAIDREGYFVLSDGTRTVYSRDGAFNFDSDFNIINSDGFKLMGYQSKPAVGSMLTKIGANDITLDTAITAASSITATVANGVAAGGTFPGTSATYPAGTKISAIINDINSQNLGVQASFEAGKGIVLKAVNSGTTTIAVSGAGDFSSGWAADTTPGTTFDKSTMINLSVPETKPGDPYTRINNFSVEADGTITGVYEDGTTAKLGKIALAKFANPGGLLKLGGNNYSLSANSGLAILGEASVGGLGNIQQSALEMSNVDLAAEFTDMIITSRAFQANSRTITTSDEMLQELINLKR